MDRTKILENLIEKLQMLIRHTGPEKDKLLAQCGLNRAQMYFLFMVHMNKSITMSDFAARANITMGAVTQIVDGLVEKGFLERIRDEKDRRVVFLQFSTEGLKKFQEMKTEHMKHLAKMFDVLSNEELESMQNLVAKLITKLSV